MNYKVISAVNWFENQPLDKGWNIGINKYWARLWSNTRPIRYYCSALNTELHVRNTLGVVDGQRFY